MPDDCDPTSVKRDRPLSFEPYAGKDFGASLLTPGPVHVVEIVDHPSLLRRAPSQPLLRQRADAGMSIPAKNPSQPK